MRQQRSRPFQSACRSGFTLFEVLIAMSLSILLIAAVYVSFDLYWKLRTAGEEEVQRAQVARAVLQRIELDIRAVTFQETSGDESADSESPDEEDDGTTEITITDPAEAYSRGNAGLVGDATNLVLSVSLPQSHANYAAFDDEAALGLRTSDLRSVTYLLAGEGLGDLQEAVAERFTATAEGGDSTVIGLARLEGDRLTLQQADMATDVDLLADQARLLAPEIKSLLFEYFDGYEWQEEWDSSLYGSLPIAVRITIGFPSDDQTTTETDAGEPIVYRLTVLIPRSTPGMIVEADESTTDEEG